MRGQWKCRIDESMNVVEKNKLLFIIIATIFECLGVILGTLCITSPTPHNNHMQEIIL